MGKVTVHRERRVFDAFFKIDEAILSHERFDGSMSPQMKRLCLERGDAVAALVYEPGAGQLLFVEQFRYPSHQRGHGWIREVVAGMVDPDESPLEALERELCEELGYAMKSAEKIAHFFGSPGTSSEQTHLYYVIAGSKVAQGGGVEAEDEDLRTITLSPEAALAEVAAGTIHDAKTLVALLWFQNTRPDLRTQGG